MSDNEKKYYLNLQAGANQSQNLAALMKNYKTALEATTVAEEAHGSAARENARYMESMEGKLNNLKSAWEQFSYEMIDSDFLKAGIDALTKFVTFLSSDVGQGITKATLAVAGLNLAFKGLGAIFGGGLIGKLGSFIKIGGTVAGAAEGAAVAVEGAGLAASGASGGFAALLGAINPVAAAVAIGGGLLVGLYALNKYLEYKNDPARKYAEVADELANTEEKLSGVKKEIQELEAKEKGGEKLTGQEKHRLKLLKEQTKELEKQAKLQRGRERKAYAKKERVTDKGVKKTEAFKQKKRELTERKGNRYKLPTDEKVLEAMGNPDKLQSKVIKLQDAIGKAGKEYKETGKVSSESMEKVGKAMDSVKKKQKAWLDEYGEVEKMPKDMQKSYKETKKLTKAYDHLTGKIFSKMGDKGWGALSDKQVEKAIQDFKDLGETIGITKDKAGEIDTIDYNQFLGGLESIGFTTDEARDALEELGKTNPDIKVNIAGVEVAIDQVDEVEDFLDKLNGKDSEATVEINGSEVAVQDIGDVQTYMDLLNGKISIADLQVNGGKKSKEDAQETKAALDDIPNTVSSHIFVHGYKKAQKNTDTTTRKLKGVPKSVKSLISVSKKDSAIDTVKKRLASLPISKVITVTVSAIISGGRAILKKLGFAKGTRNAPEGLAEVNEQGWEFIRDAETGKLRIAGGGKKTVTMLGKGDAVYTHAESKRMLSDQEDIEVPQHAKGSSSSKKKKAAQKAKEQYKKGIEKIQDRYDEKVNDLEYEQSMNHYSDAWLNKKVEKAYKSYNKKIKKYNKKNKNKIKKYKIKQVKSLGKERKQDKNLQKEDTRHDALIADIDTSMGNFGRSKSDDVISNSDRKKQINYVKKQKDKHRISAEEYKEYVRDINKAYLDGMVERFDASKNNYKKSKESLRKFASEGKITWEEYYDYVKELDDKMHDYGEQLIDKTIDNFHVLEDNVNTAAKSIKTLGTTYGLTADEITEQQNELYKTALSQNMDLFGYNKKSYSEMKKMVQNYYNSGILNATEYYEHLQQLAEGQLENEKERIQQTQEANSNRYSLAKAYVEQNIKLLEKESQKRTEVFDAEREKYEKELELLDRENEKQEEKNRLIELQSDLEKARSQKARVYRKGEGFVYEQDADAIREATQALREYESEMKRQAIQDKIDNIDKQQEKFEENPLLESWNKVRDLFDDLEARADIKDLEQRLGATAGGLFGGYGTNLSAWEKFIKDNLATDLGYTKVLEAMDKLDFYSDIESFLTGAGGTVTSNYITSMINKNRFASGTLNAPNGLARVAESGYEIALLGKGDAVMPHGVSENLMKWGQYSPAQLVSSVNDNGSVSNFNFDNLTLPNVVDANSFINELNKLPNMAIQYSKSRV